MGLFERFLTLWVALAIAAGVLIGQFAPAIPETLSRFEVAQVSIPVAVLIWAMIFPMMVQVDFTSILGVRRQPKGLVITTAVNWLIKPFTMFAIAWFFFTVVFAPLIPPNEPMNTWLAPYCWALRPVLLWFSCGATSLEATRPTLWFRWRLMI